MPLLIPQVFDKKTLKKTLKSFGIKLNEIEKVFSANRSTLIYLKNEELCKFYPYLFPKKTTVEEIKSVHTYVEKFKTLIDLERSAEIKTQEEEIRKLSGKERELFGRAILNLKGFKAGTKFHLYLVRFSREKSIETEIRAGDVVLISQGNPLKSNLLGTVFKLTEKTITVAFEQKPPKWVYKRGVRIDLYVNDVTFRRMSENLEILRHATGRQRELRNIIIGLKEPCAAKGIDFTPVDSDLNDTQLKAVKLALGAKDFFLIHGPPGTGKTRTLTELIIQLVRQGKKVLATADSNIAVDNLILNLSKYPNLKIVRIGHPARVMEELESFSIFALSEKHPEAENVKIGWNRVRSLIEKRDKFIKPIPSLRRGLSDEEIIYFGKRKQSIRGISKSIIHSMAKWLSLNYEIDKNIKVLKEKEKEIFKDIILEADIVVSTNSMVFSEFLQDFHFDVAVIDEGSQQIEPSTLIPIMKADKFYIAGDHRQLPPTILSEEAKELENTLFEKLIKNYPDLSVMLKIQYRMNEKIMEFPNQEFYNGLLKPAALVKNHTLSDLKVKKPEKFKEILAPEEALSFLDTSGSNAFEFQPEGSTSYENYVEVHLVLKLVEELLKMGINKKDIGIITPYAAQVKLLKQLLLEKNLKIEVNSVDGFQGREKEVILISFVRSNNAGEIGFLNDLRRLNVAITRARRKLICIGNAETLSHHPTYQRFIEYIKTVGTYKNLKDLGEI